MDADDKLQKSFDNFKSICPNDDSKLMHLPNWLSNTSYRFVQEFKGKFPKGYYHYKRGTIIRVNFGVNMGSEFSNTHFAIVLDKKDNSKKRTLTVLPLTSKQKIGRYSLGEEIFNQTIVLLNLHLDNINSRLEKLSKLSEKDRQKESASLMADVAAIKKVINVYRRYNKDSFVRLSDITTISKFRIQRINKFDPSGKIILSEQQMKDISNKLMKLYIK